MTDTSSRSKFTPEQVELVVDHLKQVAPKLACIACGLDNFMVHPKLIAIPVVTLENPDFSQEFYPSLIAVCTNCGHVEHFMPTNSLLKALSSTISGGSE